MADPPPLRRAFPGAGVPAVVVLDATECERANTCPPGRATMEARHLLPTRPKDGDQ